MRTQRVDVHAGKGGKIDTMRSSVNCMAERHKDNKGCNNLEHHLLGYLLSDGHQIGEAKSVDNREEASEGRCLPQERAVLDRDLISALSERRPIMKAY